MFTAALGSFVNRGVLKLKKDLAVLVVLYNCKPENCASYNDLMKKAKGYQKIEVVFWNNGPSEVALNEPPNNVVLKESLENISLAKVYNKFISSVQARKYLILDDDTHVNQLFIDSLIAGDFKYIAVPNVIAKRGVCYPIFKRRSALWGKSQVACCGEYSLDENALFFSIGSGVCINENLIPKILDEFDDVFDERFYIYGVDTSFFTRLSKLKDVNISVFNEIEHSLSRLDEVEFNSFRFNERAMENVLFFRFYPSISSMVRAVKFFYSKRARLETKLVKTLIKAFFKGVHPSNE